MLSFLHTFKPGASCQWAHKEWSVGITLAGRAHETHPDGDYFQDKDALMVRRTATFQSWRVLEGDEPWTCLYFNLGIAPSMLNHLLQLPEIRPGVFKLPLEGSSVLRKVKGSLFKAHRLLKSSVPNREELAANAVECALLWCQTEIAQKASPLDPRLQKAIDHLTKNLAGTVYLEDVANAASLSVPRFMFLFRRHLGMSPMMYLERLRMERAGRMLSVEFLSIKEVAASVGYSDLTYFCKRFSHAFKTSPGRYRKAHPSISS